MCLEIVFDFRWLCADVTHPRPLSRGKVLGAAFFLVMSSLWCVGFPSREGIKGCVTVRGAGWDEVFLLLFGEVVFLGFGWLLLISVAVCGRHTPPSPLKRGGFGACFLLKMSGLWCGGFPLLRGEIWMLRSCW